MADAWAAPILTDKSKMDGCLKYIEPIVFKRERRTPSTLEFSYFIARNKKLAEESKQIEAVIIKSDNVFQDKDGRVVEGSEILMKLDRDVSTLVKGSTSLVRAIPARTGLADKAYFLMVFAAATMCLETVYCSYVTAPCMAL